MDKRVFMILRLTFILSLFQLTFIACTTKQTQQSDKMPLPSKSLEWKGFDHSVFEEAKKENKLVLLDIGANWCHWCHVMDEKTYADTAIQQYLQKHFILAREDQDSRPDLYATYRKWGWPAIIVFNADQEELLRLRGYQPKDKFRRKLGNVLNNPIPIEEEAHETSQIEIEEQALLDKFVQQIDHEKGMYQSKHKYLELNGVLLGCRYYHSIPKIKDWLDLTIENSYHLNDPVWGGAYQYSTHGKWTNQHYEKLLRVQANYIESYARYGMVSSNSNALVMAEKIYAYCERFLKTETPLFACSQNADVIVGQESSAYYSLEEQERLKIGVPSVDSSLYLKENAQMAKALVYLWAATKKDEYLKKANEIVLFITSKFNEKNGIYSRSPEIPDFYAFEGNRVLFGTCLLLYQIGHTEYHQHLLTSLSQGILDHFETPNGMTATFSTKFLNQTSIVATDNVRFIANLTTYAHMLPEIEQDFYTAKADSLFARLDQQFLTRKAIHIAQILPTRIELNATPYHAVYISDQAGDAQSKAFFRVILAQGDPFIIFEQAVKGEFTPEQEALYGNVDSGTLFMCTDSYCSAPMQTPDQLTEFLENTAHPSAIQ
jgi:hypothetical protein